MSENIGDRFFRADLAGLVLTQMAEHEKRAALVFCFGNSGRTCFTCLNDECLRLAANAGCYLQCAVQMLIRTLRFRR